MGIGVESDPAGQEPARERASQVGRIDLERQPARREPGMYGPEPRSRAHHAHPGSRVHLHVIEPRQIQRQAAVVGNAPAHRGRGGAPQRDRHATVARPAQGGGGLGGGLRLEDQVGHGARERSSEEASQIDVLVAICFGAQEVVGDDPLGEASRRRGAGGRVARAGRQGVPERLGQLGRTARGTALGEGAALVEEDVQVRKRRSNDARAVLGGELCELGQREPDGLFEKRGFGHPIE